VVLIKDITRRLIDAAKEVQGNFVLSEEGLEAGAVGAALLTADNNIYTGICIELACGIGFCAEHAAISEMLKNRETVIKQIVALNSHKVLPPCGRCREMMVQLNKENLNTEVVLSAEKKVKLKELIPYHWLQEKYI